MPQYRWLNKDTGKITEVYRSFDDYLVPPEEPGNWQKLIDPSVGIVSPEGGNQRFSGLKTYREIERAKKLAEASGDIKEAKRISKEFNKLGGK